MHMTLGQRQQLGSGASARAVTTSASSGGTSSIREAWTVTVPAAPGGLAQECGLTLVALDQVGHRRPEDGQYQPGSPAPLPRSAKYLRPGGHKRQSWPLSSIWRRQGSSNVAAPTRVDLPLPARSSSR